MKTSKRFLALVLSALMIFSVVIIPGADLSLFGVEADAAVTLGGITQQRVVSNYESLYAGYQSRFFGGSDTNWPTNFVIPGLGDNDDYTPQGMTYWKAKEWILISAYDASGQGRPSVIYALDAVTTEFVALFKIYNDAEHTVANNSHGGGIAASEYNFYFADDGSNISYIPLSEMDVAKETVKNIHPWGSIDCSAELTPPDGNAAAKTSYCCYDDGVLWAGNFHWYDDSRYTNYAYNNSDLKSMLMGYKLVGNSSEEEWYYLSKNFNLINITTGNGTGSKDGSNITWTATNYDGANAEIRGSITYGGINVGEFTSNFAKAELKEGVKYKIEFISSNNQTDIYLFATNAGNKHTNVKQSSQTIITNLGDGRYHYEMVFTAGLKPTGADSTWPTTQSTDGSFSGSYNIRFDQDNISADRDFVITDLSISEYAEANGFTPDKHYEGIGCAGNPTYVVGLTNIDRVQYAMVDKGKIYISRSWSRSESTNHVRELIIGDMDIYSPGNTTLTINGRERRCHTLTGTLNRFGGGSGDAGRTKMLYMGEALCVIEDYLYMFGESAAYTYRAKESNKCPEPIDVIWKIDQHTINGVERPVEEIKSMYYEKIDNASEIVDGEEYILVFESAEKDPVTQKNILYAVDSFGGYGGAKLPKKLNESEAYAEYTNHSMGIIGYPLTSYSTGMLDNGTEVLYIDENDDNRKSIRWTITPNGTGGYSFLNSDYYYGNNRYLCFAHEVFTLNSGIEYCGIVGSNGNFNITDWRHTLWCNAGYTQEQLDKYTYLYKNHGQTGYLPVYNGLEEVKGTFHIEPANPSADEAVPGDYKIMHIYKRVQDPYASTLETDVYTDLNAELQADGTYTINLETYATAAVQYMDIDHERPTDFIFVLDTSGSMSDSSGVTSFKRWGTSDTLSFENAAGDKNIADMDNCDKVYTGNIYYMHTDGNFYRISCMAHKKENKKQWVKLWYTANGKNYYLMSNGTVRDTEPSWEECVLIEGYSATGLIDPRYKKTVYTGVHYSYETVSNLEAMKNIVNSISYKIANTDSDHRVSLISFNESIYATSYMVSDSGSITQSTTVAGTDFTKVFFSSSNFNAFRNQVNALTVSSATDRTPQPSTGLSRAANTFSNCGQDYTPTGSKAACTILITCAQDISDQRANEAIARAKECKEYGSFIYSVKVGSYNGSNTSNFFDYTSSNYISAESLTSPGLPNKHTNIDYSWEQTSNVSVSDFASNLLSSSITNSTKAYLRIDESTSICENIGQFFDATNLSLDDFECSTIDAKYDGLGRLYFDEETKQVIASQLAPDFNSGMMVATDAYTLNIKGFDFSDHYVSTANISNGNAKKLVVTISGLTLKPEAINNEAITIDENTGIYLKNGIKRKGYPTEYINIPEYTYVLDYGIGMLDTDVNGTLCSIDDQPRKQSTYKTELTEDYGKNNVTIKTVNGNQDLVYGLKPDGTGSNNSGYCLIKRPDETYDWFKINVVPASNVYFEEELATPQVAGNQKWTLSKNEAFDFSQNLTSTNDVYGYDSNYKNEGAGFSHGSVYTSEVNDMNLRSDTLKFDYTGTAIDLYGSCGEDTGIYIVTIRNADNKVEKVYITDTYLSDSSLYGNNHRINQVPIVHHENTSGFGKYTVEVTSAYLNSMVGQRNPVATFGMRDTEEGVGFYTADFTEEAKEAILMYAEMEELLGEDIEVTFCDENSVLNGGTGADVATTFGFFSTNLDTDREFDVLTNYFDGFRIYQPTFGNHDGNYPEYEQGAQFFNVADNLLTADEVTNAENTGIAFIEKIKDSEYEQQDYGFSSYTNIGPKNELYLQPGKSIAINVFSTSNAAKAMISLRAINGVANATIAANNGTTTISKAYTVDHVAEMYYRIDGIEFSEGTTGTITITNNSSNILVVDTVKLASGLNMGVMMMSAMPRIRMMMAAPAEEAEPNTLETEEIPDIPTPEAPPVVEMPEGPSTTPEGDTGAEEEKDFIEQITENFTKLLNMIQSMLERIVNLLKSIMA
ncbi:MAG: hypothetical protein J6A97_10485 [Clostridia bacterium]|nr:hypothetical protein [Clostridia bacterium]